MPKFTPHHVLIARLASRPPCACVRPARHLVALSEAAQRVLREPALRSMNRRAA